MARAKKVKLTPVQQEVLGKAAEWVTMQLEAATVAYYEAMRAGQKWAVEDLTDLYGGVLESLLHLTHTGRARAKVMKEYDRLESQVREVMRDE